MFLQSICRREYTGLNLLLLLLLILLLVLVLVLVLLILLLLVLVLVFLLRNFSVLLQFVVFACFSAQRRV